MRTKAPSTRLARTALLVVIAAAAAGCADNTSSTDTGTTARDGSAPDDAGTGTGSTGDPADAGISPLPSSDSGTTPVTSVSLPFHVSDQFIPSGYMGASQDAMNGVKMSNAPADCIARTPGVAGDCYKVSFTATVPAGGSTWAGVYWQSPANNWGAKPGKQIAAGAQKVSFYAAGAAGGEKVQFCAGGVNTKGTDPTLTHRDRFTVQMPAITLTTIWEKYELSLVGATYDEVLGGFCWVNAATASGTTTFYLDDVQWLP